MSIYSCLFWCLSFVAFNFSGTLQPTHPSLFRNWMKNIWARLISAQGKDLCRSVYEDFVEDSGCSSPGDSCFQSILVTIQIPHLKLYCFLPLFVSERWSFCVFFFTQASVLKRESQNARHFGRQKEFVWSQAFLAQNAETGDESTAARFSIMCSLFVNNTIHRVLSFVNSCLIM